MRLCDGPECGAVSEDESPVDWLNVTMTRNGEINTLDFCPDCADALAEAIKECE